MTENISLSVILPIKSSKAKDFDTFFEKAINSLMNQDVKLNELIIIHTKEDSLVEILNKPKDPLDCQNQWGLWKLQFLNSNRGCFV